VCSFDSAPYVGLIPDRKLISLSDEELARAEADTVPGLGL